MRSPQHLRGVFLPFQTGCSCLSGCSHLCLKITQMHTPYSTLRDIYLLHLVRLTLVSSAYVTRRSCFYI